MARTVYLKTPLTEEDVRGLQLDDVVYLTGDAYTMMYIDHFTRLTGMIKAGEPLPMELKGNVIYNTGTIFRREEDGTYDFRAIGATTSSKFNAYTPEFIRLSGVRAVIGKGGMDRNVLDAMQECGCVYLAIVGGCSAIYTPHVELKREFWPTTSCSSDWTPAVPSSWPWMPMGTASMSSAETRPRRTCPPSMKSWGLRQRNE